jgi:uncharacterized protein YbaR (Trm112 family)
MDKPQLPPAKPAAGSDAGWETVANVDGMIQANLVVNFLQAHGFSAMAWQEGAGQALGLTVGYLGTAHVLVPPAEANEARRFLAEVAAESQESMDEATEEADGGLAPAARAALGVTAFAVSGLAAPLALGLAAALSGDDQEDEPLPVDCPHCGVALELDAQELSQGWYVCPDCRRAALILDSVNCPHCRTELELSDEELARQAFDCPECGHHVTMT